MQYHYVVVYDDKTQEFTIDYDTQDAKFQGKPLYDEESDTWVELEEDHWADDSTTYNRAADALWVATQNLQLLTEEK